MLASDIITRVEKTLLDESNVAWTEAELLLWISTAQKEVVRLQPIANTKKVDVIMVAGTRQTLPADALKPIRFGRNMGTDGLTPGSALRLTTLDIMDITLPEWHVSDASSEVKMYAYSPLDRNVFHVYPPQPDTGMGYIEIVYSADPVAITAAGDTLVIDNDYEGALVDYVLYRAFSKDSENQTYMAKSAGYRAAFSSVFAAPPQPQEAAQ